MGNVKKDAVPATRSTIALLVLGGSSVVLVIIAMALIFATAEAKRAEVADKIFTMVLPMLATWVGTVLAYYFSGDNFDKAHKNASEMVEQMRDGKLRQIAVKDVMISKNMMEVVSLGANDDPGKVMLLDECINRLGESITRLPVLAANGSVKFVIHQSLLYKFVTQKTIEMKASGKDFDLTGQTLQDFLKHNHMESRVAKSIAFVSIDESLADAKNAMERLVGCQDVFVTADGHPDKPVKGWLTNVEITKYAKA